MFICGNSFDVSSLITCRLLIDSCGFIGGLSMVGVLVQEFECEADDTICTGEF